LSRERSDARKYPAIDPLTSWSKYKGIIDDRKVAYARDVLFHGSEVNQMMKVVGEEGTSVDDYIVYQKSEFLDAVYLQQNSFDPVDAAVPVDRQRYSFDKLFRILATRYNLTEKKDVRTFFNQLRQKFLDWNDVAWQSDRFREVEKELDEMYQEKAVSVDPNAETLM
jgi:V/A-type H+-transporting ATPase subunit A